MGADHPVSFCKDYQGGRSFYTGLGNTPELRREADHAPQGRDRLGGRPERPGLQRLRRDRAAQLPADEDRHSAESAGADRLRPAAGRPHPPDGPPRHGAPARPGHGHDQDRRQLRGPGPAADDAHLHTQRGRPLRAGGRQQLRDQQVGVPVLLAADGHGRQALGRRRSSRRRRRTRTPATRRRRSRHGIRTSATSSSRASSSSRTPAGPRLDLGPSSRSCGLQQPPGVLPRRGRHRLRQAQQPVVVTGDDTPAGGIDANGYGPFNDQKTDEQQTVRVTNATGGTFTLTFNGQTTAPIAVQRDRGAGRLRARGALEHRRRQHPDQRRPGEHGERQRVLPPHAEAVRPEPDHRRRRRADRHATPTVARRRRRSGGWYQRPTGDSRRSR